MDTNKIIYTAACSAHCTRTGIFNIQSLECYLSKAIGFVWFVQLLHVANWIMASIGPSCCCYKPLQNTQYGFYMPSHGCLFVENLSYHQI